MDEVYYRVSRGLNYYELMTESQMSSFIKHDTIDYYKSIFVYNKQDYEYWLKNKSIAGIKGRYTNTLVFDFDSADSLGLAKNEMTDFIAELQLMGIPNEALRLTFSGKKGFGLEIVINEKFTPEEHKNICLNLASKYSTCDKVIYDANRILRIPNTKHATSGLYKTPMNVKDFASTTIDEILRIANFRSTEEFSYIVIDFPNNWEKHRSIIKKTKTTNIVNSDSKPMFSHQRVKLMGEAKTALELGFFERGERSTALMILCSTYKAQGVSIELAYRMLKGVIEVQTKRTGQEKFDNDELWNNVVSQVYSPTWKGGTYSYDDTPLLQTITQRLGLKVPGINDAEYVPIVMSQLGGAVFKKYAESFFNTRIYTGLSDLDETFPICAGSNVAIVAAASAGKTAFALNILRESNKQNIVSVFASLDMSKSRLYEKMLYSVTNGKLTKEQLYNEYLNGKGQAYDDMVQQSFPNTYIFSKSSPTILELRKYIDKVQEHTGKPVRLLMVDYFERISSEKTDDNSAAKEIAGGLQDLISDYPELTPITLYQPTKLALGGGPDKPILNYLAIKGSSFIYQSARQIISLWRPMFTPELYQNDKFIEMAILKNDLGELGKFCYNWEGKTGLIKQMSSIDKLRYDKCMALKHEFESKLGDL